MIFHKRWEIRRPSPPLIKLLITILYTNPLSSLFLFYFCISLWFLCFFYSYLDIISDIFNIFFLFCVLNLQFFPFYLRGKRGDGLFSYYTDPLSLSIKKWEFAQNSHLFKIKIEENLSSQELNEKLSERLEIKF